MRILMVNKFLYPNGGAETYVFQLGKTLQQHGHEVQYFGMQHEGNCVGNTAGVYTRDMDFHCKNPFTKVAYAFRTIYSMEACQKIRRVLVDFEPDVVHLNNFNFQLTPSIILEIRKWEKAERRRVKIVFTAHDYQLLCPNHQMRNPNTHMNCEECSAGGYYHCVKGRCIHRSALKSLIGAAEGYFWRSVGVYRQMDTIICPTHFMKNHMDVNPVYAARTVVMYNFVQPKRKVAFTKKDYVLYFGRFSEEKGIRTLVSVCGQLPAINFVFAGSGPLSGDIPDAANIRNVGFQTGDALARLIGEARFSICASECYENCPYAVLESLQLGTPVLGADIGGIPELIRRGENGELFESGNPEALRKAILYMHAAAPQMSPSAQATQNDIFETADAYYEKLMHIYQ